MLNNSEVKEYLVMNEDGEFVLDGDTYEEVKEQCDSMINDMMEEMKGSEDVEYLRLSIYKKEKTFSVKQNVDWSIVEE